MSILERERETEEEQPLLVFQVLTDTHLTSEASHANNRNFARALGDILANAPNSRGIMHVGDVTDHGYPEEYEELRRIWKANEESLPDMLFALGNHDLGLGGDWLTHLLRFKIGRAHV